MVDHGEEEGDEEEGREEEVTIVSNRAWFANQAQQTSGDALRVPFFLSRCFRACAHESDARCALDPRHDPTLDLHADRRPARGWGAAGTRGQENA